MSCSIFPTLQSFSVSDCIILAMPFASALGLLQSKRFYIAGLGAAIFLVLFLLLVQTLPQEPNPDAITPVRWPAHQGMREHEDSGRTTWESIDWSQFAYVQYVTNLPYLCNSVMLFESLHRLGCKADRLMMYPSEFSLEDESKESWLLRKAQDEYRVKLKPIQVQRRTTHDRKLLKDRIRIETDFRSRNLGGELHKASRIQPDRLPARPSS